MRIVDQIATDPEYKDICKNIAHKHHSWEDLYQEMILHMCEQADSKLQKMKREGWLKFHFVRVATNKWSNRGYPHDELPTHLDTDTQSEEYDTDADKLENDLRDALGKMHWYDREILKAVNDVGSIRKVSKKTGITFHGVRESYKKAKHELKKKLNNQKR